MTLYSRNKFERRALPAERSSGASSNALFIWIAAPILVLIYTSFTPLRPDWQAYGGLGTGNIAFKFLGYFRYGILLTMFLGLCWSLIRTLQHYSARTLISIKFEAPWIYVWMTLMVVSFARFGERQFALSYFIEVLWLGSSVFFVKFAERNGGLLNYLFASLSLALGLSLISVVILPDRAIHTGGGALNENLIGLWKGIFVHKNLAGGHFMYLAVAAVLLSVSKSVPASQRAGAAVTLVGTIAFIIMSGSISALVTPLAAIVIAWLIAAGRRNYVRFFALDAISVLYILFPFLYCLIDKPYTGGNFLDGRNLIWSIAIDYGSKMPIFGHGFMNGFGSESIVNYINEAWLTKIGHAHSGVLDIYVQFGIVGILLLLFMVRSSLHGYARILSIDKSKSNHVHFVCLSMFVAGLLRSIVEPEMMNSRGTSIILLFLAIYPSVVRLEIPIGRSAKAMRAGERS